MYHYCSNLSLSPLPPAAVPDNTGTRHSPPHWNATLCTGDYLPPANLDIYFLEGTIKTGCFVRKRHQPFRDFPSCSVLAASGVTPALLWEGPSAMLCPSSYHLSSLIKVERPQNYYYLAFPPLLGAACSGRATKHTRARSR